MQTLTKILFILLLLPSLCFAQTFDWTKPITDAGWAEDVKAESLHIKFDYQLVQMKDGLEVKLPRAEDNLYWIQYYPQAEAKRVIQEARGREEKDPSQAVIDAAILEEENYYNWKVDKLKQSIERIEKELDLRDRKAVDRKPVGTTYYIDFDNGNDGNDGLGTGGGNAWATLDKFTENARSAGDVAIVRRGMAQPTNSDLNFTSTGTINNPITLEADFDDAWGDETTASETATLIFGSKTVTFAGDISGDIAAGDWIYETTEDNRVFAYEVDTITGGSNELVTLHLPYKGNQAGPGKTIEIMPYNTRWGWSAGDYQVNLNNDENWILHGLHLSGTDITGVIRLTANLEGMNLFKDLILEGNGTGDVGIYVFDSHTGFIMRRCRIYNVQQGFATSTLGRFRKCEVYDSLFDTCTVALFVRAAAEISFYDTEINGGTRGIYVFNALAGVNIKLRNVINSATAKYYRFHFKSPNSLDIEDWEGTIGDNRQINRLSVDSVTAVLQSDTGTVRSGGGATSILVTPHTTIDNNWEYTYLPLFEYPIYTDTSSKTYTVYIKPENTGEWTANPSASELWIEAEFWGHATNNHRKITKSTGTIDMTSNTWQTLTVTIQPAQVGILYLRGFYAKPKETGKENFFYIDVAPIIS